MRYFTGMILCYGGADFMHLWLFKVLMACRVLVLKLVGLHSILGPEQKLRYYMSDCRTEKSPCNGWKQSAAVVQVMDLLESRRWRWKGSGGGPAVVQEVDLLWSRWWRCGPGGGVPCRESPPGRRRSVVLPWTKEGLCFIVTAAHCFQI